METKKIKITLDESEIKSLIGEGYEANNGLTSFYVADNTNIYWARKIVESLGYEIKTSKFDNILFHGYEVFTNMPYKIYKESL